MTTPTTTKPSSIASRLRSFGVVLAALRVQSGEAVSDLDRRKAATLPRGRRSADDSALDRIGDASYREIFAHLADELSVAKAAMISANSSHLGRLAQVVELQERRDDLKRALYSRFVKLRRTYETLYGSHRGFPVLAISGRTPRHATGLVAQVRETAGFLAKPRVELPRLDVAGITVNPRATAAQLAAGADELAGALADLGAALKLAEVTRAAKNDAIAAYDATFLRVAKVAESLFHFAGLHEQAKRVRPSTRRPGRRLAEAGPEPESGDTAARPPTAEISAEPEAGAPAVESGLPPVRPRDFPASRLRLVLKRRGDGDPAEIETPIVRDPSLPSRSGSASHPKPGSATSLADRGPPMALPGLGLVEVVDEPTPVHFAGFVGHRTGEPQ